MPNTGNHKNSTLGQMISAGQRVLCVFGPEQFVGSGFEYLWAESAIYNTYANSPDLDAMVCVRRMGLFPFSPLYARRKL